MLYDIVPPLIFFASLGGIIVIMSRVVARVRRERLSAYIRSRAMSQHRGRIDRVFKPGLKVVHLVTNRLALVSHAITHTISRIRSSFSQWRDRRRQRAEEEYVVKRETEREREFGKHVSNAGIQEPSSTWGDRASGAARRVQEIFSSWRGSVAKWLKKRAEHRRVSADAVELEAEGMHKETAEKKVERRPKVCLITDDEDSKVVQKKYQYEGQTFSEESSSNITLQGQKGKEDAKTGVSPRDKASKGEVMGERKAEKAPLLSQMLRRKKGPSILEQASSAIHAGQYDEAEDILVPHIVQHAKDIKAYMLLGKIALRQCAWEEAIEIYDQVLKIKGRQTGVHKQLGYAALKAGKFTLALQELQKAHEEEPRNIIVLRQLLKIARRLDNKILERTTIERLDEVQQSKEGIFQR